MFCPLPIFETLDRPHHKVLTIPIMLSRLPLLVYITKLHMKGTRRKDVVCVLRSIEPLQVEQMVPWFP